jgi:hypothetical protein
MEGCVYEDRGYHLDVWYVMCHFDFSTTCLFLLIIHTFNYITSYLSLNGCNMAGISANTAFVYSSVGGRCLWIRGRICKEDTKDG